MKTTVKIGEAIYEILKNIKNVYPLVADEGTEFPFVIYRRSSGASQSNKDGIYSTTSIIDVMVASSEYEESVDIADKVIKQMEATEGNISGFTIYDIRMIDSNESYMENAFVQEMKFQVEFSV